MSLRARLLVAVLGLAAVGFLVAGSVTYALLNSFLTSRLDQQLAQAADPAGHILTDALNGRTPGPGDRGGGGGPGGRPGPLPPGTYAALVDSSGAVIQQQSFGFTSEQQSAHPTLPNPVPLPSGRGAPVFLTLPGANGAGSYRAVVARADDAVNGDVLVATPLTDVQSTLQRLVLLELGVGLSVL
ncbi:MAG TPA: hypothetical protein VK009_21235, partial [Chloroflexota bacterium]|nr:hypothetical protein [Chloroflexota bacterium]